MKLLPYDSFTILTPDPLPIVLQRLNALVEPTKTFRFSAKHAPYQGSISEAGFQINIASVAMRSLLGLPKASLLSRYLHSTKFG